MHVALLLSMADCSSEKVIKIIPMSTGKKLGPLTLSQLVHWWKKANVH